MENECCDWTITSADEEKYRYMFDSLTVGTDMLFNYNDRNSNYKMAWNEKIYPARKSVSGHPKPVKEGQICDPGQDWCTFGKPELVEVHDLKNPDFKVFNVDG